MSERCTLHPAFEADYCPSCGTVVPISERTSRTAPIECESKSFGYDVECDGAATSVVVFEYVTPLHDDRGTDDLALCASCVDAIESDSDVRVIRTQVLA